MPLAYLPIRVAVLNKFSSEWTERMHSECFHTINNFNDRYLSLKIYLNYNYNRPLTLKKKFSKNFYCYFFSFSINKASTWLLTITIRCIFIKLNLRYSYYHLTSKKKNYVNSFLSINVDSKIIHDRFRKTLRGMKNDRCRGLDTKQQ